MSIDTVMSAQTSLFDDELVDLILHDGPPESLAESIAQAPAISLTLTDSAPVLEEILNAVYSDNYPRTLVLIDWLMRSNLGLNETACRVFAEAFAQMIPNEPKPVIDEILIEYQTLLAQIITQLEKYDATDASSGLQVLHYRLLEGCGEFDQARQRISVMLERSNDPLTTAQLTNNYGYEYLLEGNYAFARRHFSTAIDIFAELLDENEVANAQVNLLTCEFELITGQEFEARLPILLEAHTRMNLLGDWRRRKTMRLLAARAEAGERLLVAIAWARRAVRASRGIETRLREDDRQYLKRLCRKLNRRKQLTGAHGKGHLPPLTSESIPGQAVNHG